MIFWILVAYALVLCGALVLASTILRMRRLGVIRRGRLSRQRFAFVREDCRSHDMTRSCYCGRCGKYRRGGGCSPCEPLPEKPPTVLHLP